VVPEWLGKSGFNMPHWYGVLLLHFGFMLHPEPSDH
jgi:hypothetical protein